MTGPLPSLVVVGRVNRGKSSILSTLAEDDSVAVSSEPGTTRDVRRFPLRVDGEALFQLVDTPGFEDAPRALRILQKGEGSAVTRRRVVEAFVEHFRDGEEFEQECKLLQPIIDGGVIIYVVDGSQPYRTNYEAEMEILRWSGQPRIALINRIRERDHTEEWKAALDQYFSIVRVFDAHRAGFRERVRLFEGLREIDESWRPAFDQAIDALERDWERRRRRASGIIAGMVASALLHTRDVPAGPDESLEARRREIEEAFHDDLRKLEEKSRRDVEALYLHRDLVRHEGPISRPILDEDLFSHKTWKTLGLSPRQLVGLGFVTGASIGGAADVMTGGTLLGGGMVIGGVLGGGSAIYRSLSRFDKGSDLLRYFKGERSLTVGPYQHPNFPWVLLDRALWHYRQVRDRAHAKRDPLDLSGAGENGRPGIVRDLPDDQRAALAKAVKKLRSRRVRSRRQEAERELAEGLVEVMKG